MLQPRATIREACRRMHDSRIGAVLVAEEDRRLLGIFTGWDAVHRVLAEGKSAARTRLPRSFSTTSSFQRNAGSQGFQSLPWASASAGVTSNGLF